ncbi:biofilm regulation phosphoprotein SiaC [Dethiosulfatarculus sandiegensis]|uniref:SiaC family regulatory phosphoprotein domain-containing protein n=1 Tax=Dethiosulfatarculus sandiegensis TaxID=1429043 RepID=A0A0D2J4M0_9BACT|nr:biofilm regulation phosphoprotein SiaC [Dethiosulfatarculus sandiegensis]KIX13044.1 hypothetical protein X474_15885 [Dethiosulfatarculus sandiegensis]
MNSLIIEKTSSTPSVEFDPQSGPLKISGESYPENTLDFFKPIIEWISAYVKEVKTITLDLYLIYMNTSSVKCMLELLDVLEEAHGNGHDITLNWFYDEDNDRALDTAEEFEEDYTMPFNIIAQQKRE